MTNDMGLLLERLREDASQLRRMVDLTAFAGSETGVRVKSPNLLLADLDEAAIALADAQARIEELECLVEQAFRDGLAYATNVENPDPDLAWQHSRARALLKDTPDE